MSVNRLFAIGFFNGEVHRVETMKKLNLTKQSHLLKRSSLCPRTDEYVHVPVNHIKINLDS